MKFNTIALSALAAVVAVDAASPTSAAMNPETSCALACPKDDNCCRAKCANVPCPDEDMADETTECAAACPQGSGSPQNAIEYAECQQACISSLFWTGGSAPTKAPVPTAASSSAGDAETTDDSSSETGSAKSSAAGGSSGSSDPTGTGSDDSSSTATGTDSTGTGEPTDDAAVHFTASTAGIFGVILAVLAL